MGILNIQASQAGLVGTLPTPIYINTNDTYTTVTTSGYLNSAHQLGQAFSDEQMALVYTTDEGPVWLKVTVDASTQTYSLEQISSPGDVVLPTIANNIIVSTDTAGTLANTTATAINRGSIQAGLSGDAGALISYSATAARGSLVVAAVANTGDTVTTISNAAMGQASVISIPDPGQATAEFIISDSAGTQNITSGGLQVDAGIVSSGLAAGGFVGEFDAYPTTTASGILSLRAAVNATGDFDTVISNGTAIAQDQVISVPDSGAATANFILSASSGSSQTITSGLSFTGGGTNIQTTGGGNFLAGSSGAAGAFYAFPATAASGELALVPVVNATGDFDTTISNSAAVAQDQIITIPDVGQATGSFLVNVLTDSDPASDIVSFDVTVTAAALATGGTVTLQASSGTKQYKIRELFLNSGGTNFSGGGGDRLATISDGTTSYSVIPAANLQALTNERWGTTAVPYPAAAAINTSTAAGAALTIAYSGGASDYAAGSMVISGIAERVA